MQEFDDILATKFEEIQVLKPKYWHDVDTGDAQPIKQAPYRVPPVHQEWINQEIEKMMENGIVRNSRSPWASPVVLVPKKEIYIKEEGVVKNILAPRFCVNYKKTNDVTKKDAFPLPRIDDLLAAMGNMPKWFSSFDLFSGYHQIGLTEKAIERSAFVTPDGQYEYTRMPFGMCNAPATFQRMMNEIFRDMLGKHVAVYLDDLEVYTATFEEHLEKVKEVLQRIRDNGLFLKPKKCTIATNKMKYLGFVIGEEGLTMDETKVTAIMKYPRPTSQTELRSFLGVATFYRRFIRNFSTVADALFILLRKDQKYVWDIDQEVAFRVLKQKLVTAPILVQPNWQKEFELYTDASAIGLGAILSQRDERNNERVICYASRGTRGPEKKYFATKLECLAVVWAVEWFKYYLYGRHFTVITDHAALKWLFTHKDPKPVFER